MQVWKEGGGEVELDLGGLPVTPCRMVVTSQPGFQNKLDTGKLGEGDEVDRHHGEAEATLLQLKTTSFVHL